ncbi:MAG: hypothetical protein Q8M88_07060 [Phenylobacterium sp.]|uniref:DUF6880 family protein n=1 Tax=Phenylobacterium sp. TaxID=1871053 RepID=UPI0027357683|nr:DUF6880 family protein [Phenylobacterium sp.]MDP3174176.1 hypothetical protein [Phenylobacterium sp.]
MKRPTPASLKKVTPENLTKLGADRLADILAAVAEGRPDLKRRLRMELAAAQGAEHLALEIDKRLGSLQASRSKVSWRQRAAFIRDLGALRALIAGRLAELDAAGGAARMWMFLALARPLEARVRDRDGAVERVFASAAEDLGRMVRAGAGEETASALADAALGDPPRWNAWLPIVLDGAPPSLARAALADIAARHNAVPGWMPIVRRLADAAGDVDAYRATYSAAALKTPKVAADVAQRWLAAGRVEAAGDILSAAAPPSAKAGSAGKTEIAEPDFDWETAWIDYLERSERFEDAQAVRWASFERTLSTERARAFTQRLTGFDDVEAESRAFSLAMTHPDFEPALRFLMEWPALTEAAQLIETRAEDVQSKPEDAELWAARLRTRQPTAARILLRKAAAAALRQRSFEVSERLSAEADAIDAAA